MIAMTVVVHRGRTGLVAKIAARRKNSCKRNILCLHKTKVDAPKRQQRVRLLQRTRMGALLVQRCFKTVISLNSTTFYHCSHIAPNMLCSNVQKELFSLFIL
jgi:hypothetical protein